MYQIFTWRKWGSLPSSFIQKIYNYYETHFRDSINAVYDLETDHGLIVTKQKEWERKIVKELKELEAYSSPNVVIKRK